MKTKKSNGNINIHMVQKSRPLGRAFKRKKREKRPDKNSTFRFGTACAENIKNSENPKLATSNPQAVNREYRGFSSLHTMKGGKPDMNICQNTKFRDSKGLHSQKSSFMKTKSHDPPIPRFEGTGKLGLSHANKNYVETKSHSNNTVINFNKSKSKHNTQLNKGAKNKANVANKSESVIKNSFCNRNCLESNKAVNTKSQNENKVKTPNKVQKHLQNKTWIETANKTEENLTTSTNPKTKTSNKRKFDELTSESPDPNNKKVKATELTTSKTNHNSEVKMDVNALSADLGEETNTNSTSSSSQHVIQAKKRHKKKKKKKRNTNTANTQDDQYKPVLVVKQANDISANWRNLKELITKSDKEKAAKQGPKATRNFTNKTNNYEKKNKREDAENSMDENGNNKIINKDLKKNKKKQKKIIIKPKKADIWFDNVDPILLGEEYVDEKEENNDTDEGESDSDAEDGKKGKLKKLKPVDSNTKAVAIDCEMVGVGIDGKESVLARVTIVDQHCRVIYDRYVKPREKVVDYRTLYSGIRPKDIRYGHDFKTVQQEVAKILKGKVLVGHGLNNDLRVLFLDHPRSRIRDTSRYKPFKTMFHGATPKLKMLAAKILGHDIQTGEHDSTEDAQAVMRIYLVHRKEWEAKRKKSFKKPSKKKGKKDENREMEPVE
ncbi:REX4, RNA exonuclease 4 [Halocaridina rubra]|uniref:RNA exonuclease 4 n=1 Tax=Halocaridina rubra TaxID=373956 RepID=A0AAN8WKS7_HALRR